MSKAKVIVGLSGGVDSSVAALLLQQQGFDVEAVFMKNWEQDDDAEHCAAEEDFADARAVCTHLQIPLHQVNFANTYWDKVFSHFLREYQAGRTPNPDILCNKEIKFKAFLDHALTLGADFIATGHYVRTDQHAGRQRLLKGCDPNKDQSYFLYTLGQTQLSKSLFPLGAMQKTDVRQIAADNGLITHKKKDSTGICFIGERKFKDFLQSYCLAQPGPIETAEGQVIAEHQGLMYHTLGQRQGLRIGGRRDASEAPWYVVAKDITRNTLIVAQGTNHPLLFKSELRCQQLHWVKGALPRLPLSCHAKIRYRQADQTCEVTQVDADTLSVTFPQAQRAITPGQSIVFYQNDECLGGGVII